MAGSLNAQSQQEVINYINQYSYPLNDSGDLQPLIDRISSCKIVMLGEASHGTHEYYTWRSKISRLLIEQHGFNFIAVEGDWPDCYRLNRYIKGYDGAGNATDVLHGFNRWPTWMWANWEVAALAEWLKSFNAALSPDKKAGFYGLDVYSLWESMGSIIKYLKDNDPEALKTAEEAFKCFEPYRQDEGQSYARASRFVSELCEAEVINLLKELRTKLPNYDTDYESAFSTEQNAIVAVNAEKYYRAMVQGGPSSWNVRDRHMAETLSRLLKLYGKESKAIVWAHNTHIGDARATTMANNGMFNIGELARDEYAAKEVALVGFGSYSGSVIAGDSWGAPMKNMDVPEGKKDSWEYFLHEAGAKDKLIIMNDLKDKEPFKTPIGHRAIGVVYDPDYEQWGNYVPSILPLRYDAFIYIDKTSALHPLDVETKKSTVPDTYPFGV